MEPSMSLAGGCACQGVRYRLRSAPMFVHCCHCKDCQRQTGTYPAGGGCVRMEHHRINAIAEQQVDDHMRLALARDLQRIWSDVLQEPLPTDLRRLIERLERVVVAGMSSRFRSDHPRARSDGGAVSHALTSRPTRTIGRGTQRAWRTIPRDRSRT
jgi:hypothetical protein